jgi:hypothetical protein
MTLYDLLKSTDITNIQLAITMMESQFKPNELRDELKQVYQKMERELHEMHSTENRECPYDTYRKIGPWYTSPPHTDQIRFMPSTPFKVLEFSVANISIIHRKIAGNDVKYVVSAQDGFYWWEMFWHEGTVNDLITAFETVTNYK